MDLKQFETLINQITARTGLNSDEIAAEIGYNKGYISQIKSRKNIPEKFINALNARFLPPKDNLILEEEQAPYGKVNFNDFMELIKNQQKMLEKQLETMSSQQETIKMLAAGIRHSKKAS